MISNQELKACYLQLLIEIKIDDDEIKREEGYIYFKNFQLLLLYLSKCN